MIHGGGGCVVSTFSDRQVGGLTTLAARLFAAADPAVDWTWVVRLDRHGLETTRYDVGGPESRRPGPFGEVRTVAPRPASSLLLKRTGWTIFQAGGPVVAPRLFGLGYRPSVRRQVPADTGLVYWVGAGIELLGFEALAAARRAGAPFVVLPALHPGVWGDTAIDARLYRSADAVVALSESERALLEGFGVDPKQIEVIRPGPTVLEGGDGPRFRAAHGIGPDEPVVAFLGRRARYKGLAATLGAVRRLRGDGMAVRLAIAGPPGNVPVPGQGMDGVVDLGICDEPTKADLLAAADVLCLPSTAESYGLVYVDAWASGTPVVAGPAPAARELVREGVDGLVAEQDDDAVAAALRRLLGDRELRRSMGEAGRARQRAELTWERAAAQQDALFARLADARRR